MQFVVVLDVKIRQTIILIFIKSKKTYFFCRINTVGAHLAKVSLNSTDPVLFNGTRYRRFTPREVARIQSFPETFSLVGTETAQYRVLGNAIPPVMIWYVANKVKDYLCLK